MFKSAVLDAPDVLVKAAAKPARKFELDSLRGLAAVSVVFCHYLNILPAVVDNPEDGNLWFLICTPLRLFSAGHEAVVFFFVLSGFVLSLPFLRNKQEYPGFFIKRVCRIWLPYIFAVILAFTCYSLFANANAAEGLSSWANRVWASPITFKVVLNHFLLIGSFQNGTYDPVLWSLVHEMRISIIFPLLMWMVLRFNWKTSLLISLAVYAVGRGGDIYFTKFLGMPNDYFMTLQYVYMFIVGILLARHMNFLGNFFYKQPSVLFRRVILVVALLLYVYRDLYPGMPSMIVRVAQDFPSTIGIAIFVIVASASASASSFLNLKPLVFLGKISYSLYLLHAIMLFSVIHLSDGRLSLWLVWGISLALTAATSVACYYLIEEPSMKIGKTLASKFSRKPKAAA